VQTQWQEKQNDRVFSSIKEVILGGETYHLDYDKAALAKPMTEQTCNIWSYITTYHHS